MMAIRKHCYLNQEEEENDDIYISSRPKLSIITSFDSRNSTSSSNRKMMPLQCRSAILKRRQKFKGRKPAISMRSSKSKQNERSEEIKQKKKNKPKVKELKYKLSGKSEDPTEISYVSTLYDSYFTNNDFKQTSKRHMKLQNKVSKMITENSKNIKDLATAIFEAENGFMSHNSSNKQYFNKDAILLAHKLFKSKTAICHRNGICPTKSKYINDLAESIFNIEKGFKITRRKEHQLEYQPPKRKFSRISLNTADKFLKTKSKKYKPRGRYTIVKRGCSSCTNFRKPKLTSSKSIKIIAVPSSLCADKIEKKYSSLAKDRKKSPNLCIIS